MGQSPMGMLMMGLLTCLPEITILLDFTAEQARLWVTK
jgi:hypothetical protein